MRLLTVVRHAKSSWDHSDLSDFERPLNERGRQDAPSMAQRLLRLPPHPDLLVSSPALRALTTARMFAEVLGIKPENISVNSRIYDASLPALLNVVTSLDDAAGHVLLFGHNPGLTELSHALATCTFDEMPTCGVARFQFAAKTWHEVDRGQGELVHFMFPKDGT